MSFSRDDIRAAATAGVITAAQTDQLVAFLEARRPPQAVALPTAAESIDADNEKFRVLGGFNDVFVAIGVALLYGALMVAGGVVAPIFLSLFGALAAWGLSEIFTRRMRLALPSIMLSNLFALSFAVTVIFVVAMFDGDVSGSASQRTLGRSSEIFSGFYGVAGGLSITLAAFLHFRRFGVPIDWAIGAGGLILAALAVAGGPLALKVPALFFAACGFAVFALALSLDLSDPLRRTTRSDAAFWLHLLAAPLMIHPLVGGLAGSVWALTSERAMMVLIAFIVIALISLTIDRRALLVSGLSYTGAALAFFVRGVSSGSGVLILTLLALAVVVLSLSAGWSRLRGWIVPLLPLGGFAARLPPPARKI
ncbi:hypothetical protein [Terrarubrum flagellatum]|uniref:hypothetical protein n=1 Tax=Terrirubrum flagellatum TaxID=2895980 RepID=UPI003144ED08